jgi:cell division protein FtsB
VEILKGPARMAVMSLVIVAILFLFVFPTRSFFAQRNQISSAEHDLSVLREQNARLAKEAARLQTDTEIARIARDEYNMVLPGEQAYAVIPAPAPSSESAP